MSACCLHFSIFLSITLSPMLHYATVRTFKHNAQAKQPSCAQNLHSQKHTVHNFPKCTPTQTSQGQHAACNPQPKVHIGTLAANHAHCKKHKG